MLRFLPNGSGTVGADYSLWIPDLLAGYFWHLNNNWFALPWFNPAQCGGVPFQADPQVGYLSVPQFLTFMMPPVAAVRASFVLFAGIGFLGAYALARSAFRSSVSAALLAGTLFMFNEFYASRMLVGHLTYQSFMLTPALAVAVMPGLPRRTLSGLGKLAPACIGGALIAAMIQGGAVHALPPALLSVLLLIVMHALRHGLALRTAANLAGAVAISCALSAGKLAASAAFIGNFPRDQYPLPGIDGLWMAVWRAVRLFACRPMRRAR